MNWLREKLVKWLNIQQDYLKLEKRITMLEKLVKIGVDVHQKSPSWAVVCIEGHPEYIKFYGARTEQIREIKHFLKKFSNSDVIIDAPMMMNNRYFIGDY